MDHLTVRIFALLGGLWGPLLTSCATVVLPPGGALDDKAVAAFNWDQSGVLPVASEKMRIFDGGPAIKQRMLDLIGAAEDYILVDSFLLTDGPEAREILDALVAKSRQGIRVHLIGDASSRFVPEPAAFAYLAGKGVPVAEFNPITSLKVLFLPAVMERDHRKFWIVDGKTLFFGGANLSELSLLPPCSGGNLDFMMELESAEAIARLVASFVSTWNKSVKDPALRVSDFPVKAGGGGSGSRYWVFDQNSVHANPTPTQVMMAALFAKAKRTAWLLEPYAFTNREILSEVRRMVARGVRVNVMLSTEVRAPRFHYASHFGIDDLTKAGATVWIFDSMISPLHYKCAVVDDELAYIGSANWNYRSYHLSRELNVMFDDPRGVGEVRRVIEDVRSHSREVSREEARQYRKPRYFLWWLVMQTAG